MSTTKIVRFCQWVANNETWQSFILSLILFNAFALGIEATPALAVQIPEPLWAIFWISQAVFVLEIVIRLIAYGKNWRLFFADFWNRFDFTVVVLSLLPAVGSLALLARVLRVLRVLRVFSVSDTLRSFVNSMRSGVPVLFFMSLVFLIIGYLWMLTGHYLFGLENNPYWRDLGQSASTVFYLALLQNVVVIVESARTIHPAAMLYFVAFYLCYFYLIAQALRAFNTASDTAADKEAL